LYVGNTVSNNVLRYNGATGAFIDTFVSSGSGGLFAPSRLAFIPEQTAIPVPAAAWIGLLGLGAVGVREWKRKRNADAA
jgi:hypothetical protein